MKYVIIGNSFEQIRQTNTYKKPCILGFIFCTWENNLGALCLGKEKQVGMQSSSGYMYSQLTMERSKHCPPLEDLLVQAADVMVCDGLHPRA